MNFEIPLSFIFGAAKTPYYIVIAASAVIILSYFFNVISKKTNIPSVILLIGAGIGMHYGLDFFELSSIKRYIIDNNNILPILGQVGLILIVLEAALDLELSKEKWPVIWKSFTVALLALLGSTALVAFVLEFFIFNGNWQVAIVCAIPLSIMSSAIIIPSVADLIEERKEFMVYESTFSDILGIMLFYPYLNMVTKSPEYQGVGSEFFKFFITLIVSVIVSYVLIWLFQRIKSQVKLFLLIALLCLLYVIGKLNGLSTLVLILIFGLMLNNSELFFQGRLNKFINHDKLNHFLHDFHVLALESAFVLRTFFFVIFGITISLGYLLDFEVALIGFCVAIALYIVRWLFLKIFVSKQTSALLFIAPRGLITVLLFFSITSSSVVSMMSPPEAGVYISPDIEKMNGVILYAILITSLLMTFSLIRDAKSNKGIVPLEEEVEEIEIEESEQVDEEDNLLEENTDQETQDSNYDELSEETDFEDPEGGKE